MELISATYNCMLKPTDNSNISSDMHLVNQQNSTHLKSTHGRQGTSNAAIWWTVLPDSLIMAYWSKAHLWALINHKNNRIIYQGIDAFIDDTTIFNVATSQNPMFSCELISETQDNISLWNSLLEASGSTLNPIKCMWAHFWWIDMNGTLMLAESKQETEYQINISWFGAAAQQVSKMNLTTANRYLGVQVTMDGNWTKELNTHQDHNSKFIQLLIHSHFNWKEANTIYHQCDPPAVTYPLPVTMMPIRKIHEFQKQVTTGCIPAQIGIPEDLPRSRGVCPNHNRRGRLLTLWHQTTSPESHPTHQTSLSAYNNWRNPTYPHRSCTTCYWHTVTNFRRYNSDNMVQHSLDHQTARIPQPDQWTNRAGQTMGTAAKTQRR